MIITPPTLVTDDDLAPPGARVVAARVVTAAQVDRAVMQLRERPGQTAAEHVHAVLRALDLTVDPGPVIPEPRH